MGGFALGKEVLEEEGIVDASVREGGSGGCHFYFILFFKYR